MKHIITSLLSALILTFSGCYADTDVDINVQVSINVEANAEMDDLNITAEMIADICVSLETMNPEPEDPEANPDKLGKWNDCETNDQCETDLCLCYVCVDITDFLPN